MPLDHLDLSNEVSTQMLTESVNDHRAWLSGQVDPSSAIITLGADALAETYAIVQAVRGQPLPLYLHSPEVFQLTAWRQIMATASEKLNQGLGFTVIDRLPMDEFNDDDMKAVFWIVGQLIGRTVAQKWDGTMLYDVKDKGKAFGYGVRGSYTNVELVFHTDNAFGAAPPEYVGLLCKYPAVSGGISRFCSLYSVHNMMLRNHPALLKRLYAPMLFDRQAEHAPGTPKTAFAPVASSKTGLVTSATRPSQGFLAPPINKFEPPSTDDFGRVVVKGGIASQVRSAAAALHARRARRHIGAPGQGRSDVQLPQWLLRRLRPVVQGQCKNTVIASVSTDAGSY